MSTIERENLHRGIPFSVPSEFTNKTRDALDVASVHATNQIGRTIFGPSKSESKCLIRLVWSRLFGHSPRRPMSIGEVRVSDFDWRDSTFEWALGVPLRDIDGKNDVAVRCSRMTYFHRTSG